MQEKENSKLQQIIDGQQQNFDAYKAKRELELKEVLFFNKTISSLLENLNRNFRECSEDSDCSHS